MKITINIPELEAKDKDHVIGILCSALDEFRNARSPAGTYVLNRYPPEKMGAWFNREKKIEAVMTRNEISKNLQQAIATGQITFEF